MVVHLLLLKCSMPQGIILPTTVTVKEHFLVLPDRSVAPILIMVDPILNLVDEVKAGTLTTVGL